MSRYTVKPLDPRYIVFVGWDRPMQTFFASVDDQKAGPNIQILDTGDDFKSKNRILSPELLIEPLAPYATLSKNLIRQLRHDQRNS